MKNRFLGMKMGSRTRPDHPRPRKTRKTDRKPRKTRKIEKFGVGGRRETPSICSKAGKEKRIPFPTAGYSHRGGARAQAGVQYVTST